MHNEDLTIRDLTAHGTSDFILIVIFEHSEQKAHIYFIEHGDFRNSAGFAWVFKCKWIAGHFL